MRTQMKELILTPGDVARRPWEPFGGSGSVRYRTLWIDPRTRSRAGVLRMEPAGSVSRHTHRYAVHHVWVAEGSCTIGGCRLDPGSYAFVPAGVEHGIELAGPGGCILFYLYLRAAMD